MHVADIKAAIQKMGGTLSHIDKENGFPIGTCSDALKTGRPKAELAISKFLGLPLIVLFPDRYRDDGSRIWYRNNSDKSEPNMSRALPARDKNVQVSQ